MPTYQTPFSVSLAAPLGPRVWRKHALPFGTWTDSKGQSLTVDRPLLERVVQSFRAGALDQVPFQLAKDDNQHTDDPERFRGEVKGVEIGSDGLYVTTEMTQAGAELLKANPHLGVSVRLLKESVRGDGVVHHDVLGHVLGCLNPQAPGMRPWEQVALAAGQTDVIDLTAPGDPRAMTLTPDDVTQIGKMIADAMATAAKPAEAKKDMSAEEHTSLSAAELQVLADEVRAAELAAAAAPAVELSAADSKRITDAEKRAADAELASRAVDARATWRETRVELAQAGCPPALLDLAEPVLSRPGAATPAVYELAVEEGKAPAKVSERDVIRKLLAETRGRVKVGYETGASEFASHDEAESKRMLAQLRAADPQTHRNGGPDAGLVAAVAAGVAAAMKAS